MKDLPLNIPTLGEFCRATVTAQVRRNKTKGAETDNRTTVIINTADLDRHGTVIVPEGGRLDDYARNPVVLINHDHNLLAARSTVGIQNGQLVAHVEDDAWDTEDPEIARWYGKVKSGLLSAASIGFRVNKIEIEESDEPNSDVYRITDWDLLEWSFVSIGSNPRAVVTQRMLDQDHGRTLDAPAVTPAEPDQLDTGAVAITGPVTIPEGTTVVVEPAPQRNITLEAIQEMVRQTVMETMAEVSAPAAPEPAAEPTPETPTVRQATPEDYAAVAVRMAPVIDELILRRLGRK